MSVKRGWKIAIAAAAIVVVFVAVAMNAGESEPSYNGRKLSEWISDYDAKQSTPEVRNAAAQAVQRIGTNAVPVLLKWLSYEKPASRRCAEERFIPLAEKFGAGRQYRRMTTRWLYQAWQAEVGLTILGTNGAPAIPPLSNMVVNAKSEYLTEVALSAITHTGTTGNKTILALLRNPDNKGRYHTEFALVPCDQRDHDLIRKELIEALKTPDPRIRLSATNVMKLLRITP